VVNLVRVRAAAATFNVTVTGTTDSNFIALSLRNAPSFTATTINWTSPAASVATGECASSMSAGLAVA
jgi:hypothetical protein